MKIKNILHVEDSNSAFRFGDSKLIKSNKKVTIPTVIADQKVMLTTDVISNDLPLLLSKGAEPTHKLTLLQTKLTFLVAMFKSYLAPLDITVYPLAD